MINRDDGRLAGKHLVHPRKVPAERGNNCELDVLLLQRVVRQLRSEFLSLTADTIRTGEMISESRNTGRVSLS